MGNDDPVPSRPAAETVTLPGARPMSTIFGPIRVWPGELATVRDRALRVAVEGGTVRVAALSDVEPPAEDADLVRHYLGRLATRAYRTGIADTTGTTGAEPDPSLRRHSGRRREDVWPL